MELLTTLKMVLRQNNVTLANYKIIKKGDAPQTAKPSFVGTESQTIMESSAMMETPSQVMDVPHHASSNSAGMEL